MNKVLFTVKIPPLPSTYTLSHTYTHFTVEILLLQCSHLAYKQTGAVTQRHEINMKTIAVTVCVHCVMEDSRDGQRKLRL